MCGRFTLTRKKKDIIEEYQKRFNREIKELRINFSSKALRANLGLFNVHTD